MGSVGILLHHREPLRIHRRLENRRIGASAQVSAPRAYRRASDTHQVSEVLPEPAPEQTPLIFQNAKRSRGLDPKAKRTDSQRTQSCRGHKNSISEKVPRFYH